MDVDVCSHIDRARRSRGIPEALISLWRDLYRDDTPYCASYWSRLRSHCASEGLHPRDLSDDTIAAFVVSTWDVGSRVPASSAIAAYYEIAWGRPGLLKCAGIKLVRKAGKKKKVMSDVPAIDLRPLFDQVYVEVSAAGGIVKLSDLALRNLAMATTQIDLAVRPSDIAAMPACNFRTVPAGLTWREWHMAEEIFVVIFYPKEIKLRDNGGWWSQEIRLQVNPHNVRAFYRSTLSVALLQELMARYDKQGWLSQPRVLHGRSIMLECLFMKIDSAAAGRKLALQRVDGEVPKPVLAADTVGNQGIRKLMVSAGITGFTKGQTRHAVASYVFHLWVPDEDNEIDEAWLQAQLRHTDPGTLKRHYVCPELPPEVVSRYSLGYRGVRGSQLQLTELVRI